MIAITGATGHVGKAIVTELLEKGKNVIAIGRNEDKLEHLIVKGAVQAVGDLMDGDFVNKAFDGATAVFCIMPLIPHSDDIRRDQQIIARNYVNAVKNNGIKYVVLMSSVGAHLRNGAGVIDGLADMEVFFSELRNVNVLSLRATYFMENILSQVDVIKQAGVMGSPLKGDLKIPMVATVDIAAVAARHLINPLFKGHTVEYILGPGDYSYNEVARIMGNAIHMPDLKYVQFSYEDAKKSLVESGFVSDHVADQFLTMELGFNEGKLTDDYRRTPENTTPTTLEEFSRVFANAYGEVLV